MLRIFQQSIVAFIFISLVIHVAMWKGMDWLPNIDRSLKKPESIEITIVPPQTSDDRIKRQVVEQSEKPLNDEIPEDSKFLSQHNQRVVRETRAQNSGTFTNAAQQGQKQTTPNAAPARPTASKAAKSSPQGTLPALKDLAPQFERAPRPVEDTAQPTQAGQESQSSDHLKDVNTGVQTLLNTREFKYATYYHRIRDQIRQYWEPSIREKVKKIFAAGRTLASTQDRITKVMVILDRNGALVKVKILGESGVQDFDDAATEAFRAAEPFPNPPEGMIEEDGTIKIMWDFVLEASNRSIPTDAYDVARNKP